jgi:hypothetical protein
MTVHRHCCCSTNPCVLADLPWKCEDAAHCYGERIKPFQEGSTIDLVLDIETAAGTIPITGGGTVSREITIHIEGAFELVSGRTGCTWQSTGATATLPTGVSGGSMTVQQLDACVEIEFGSMYLAFTKITIRPTELGAVDDAIYYMPTLYVNVEACDATTPGLRFIAVGNDLNSIVPASVSHKYFWQLGGTIDGTGVSETLLGSATIATEFGPIVPIEDYSWLGLTGSATTPADGIVRALSLRYTNWCGARTWYAYVTGARQLLEPNDAEPVAYCEGLYGQCPAYFVLTFPLDYLLGFDATCCNFGCAMTFAGWQGLPGANGFTTESYAGGKYTVIQTWQWVEPQIPFRDGFALPERYVYNNGTSQIRYEPGQAPFVLQAPFAGVSATITTVSPCEDCPDPCNTPFGCISTSTAVTFSYANWNVQAAPPQS